jgi:hypothetical protein
MRPRPITFKVFEHQTSLTHSLASSSVGLPATVANLSANLSHLILTLRLLQSYMTETSANTNTHTHTHSQIHTVWYMHRHMHTSCTSWCHAACHTYIHTCVHKPAGSHLTVIHCRPRLYLSVCLSSWMLWAEKEKMKRLRLTIWLLFMRIFQFAIHCARGMWNAQLWASLRFLIRTEDVPGELLQDLWVHFKTALALMIFDIIESEQLPRHAATQPKCDAGNIM